MLMAFKMIKSFFTIEATVHAFAGGGGKLADKLGMVSVAARALYGFLLKHFGTAKLLLRVGRRDSEGAELFPARFRHPVGSPGG